MGNSGDGSGDAKGDSIKPKASFRLLKTHSRSQNCSNTMTIHAFSRELIDVKASVVSFRTVTYHLPFSKPLRLSKIMSSYLKTFLKQCFQIWECHPRFILILSLLIVLLFLG